MALCRSSGAGSTEFVIQRYWGDDTGLATYGASDRDAAMAAHRRVRRIRLAQAELPRQGARADPRRARHRVSAQPRARAPRPPGAFAHRWRWLAVDLVRRADRGGAVRRGAR